MSGPRPRLVLVDGSSYVYRAFHALPPLTGPSGLLTNAVYGFTTMLLKLLGDAKADYLAVVFDAARKTFRDEIYADYKAHRPEMPNDLAAQLPHIHRVVAALRIPTLRVEGVEADDVIASLLTKFADADLDAVVVTADKDLMQLVGPTVRLWDTMRDRWVDVAAVQTKYGVAPEQVSDVLALMGDTSDNVPGVSGIGEKTAIALVQAFGTVEGVLDHIDAVAQLSLRGAKAVAARLSAEADSARLSKQLVLVRRDVPLTVELEDLRTCAPDLEQTRALFTELGFESLLRQLAAEVPALHVEAALLEDAAQATAQFEQARRGGWLALATISDAGPPATTPARELLMSAAGAPPVRLPLAPPALLETARAGLADPDLEIIGHDLKRDLLALTAADIPLRGRLFDVAIGAALVDVTSAGTLERLAADLLGERPAPYRGGLDGAAAGVTLLHPLAERLRAQLTAGELTHLLDEVEMPLVRVLAAIERRGMLVDVEHLRRLSAEFAARMDALMRDIHALAGGEFNINSPPQLRSVLFERLSLSTRGVKRGKTGLSTDVDVLTRLAAEHPLPAKILDYRALSKLKSTYLDALPLAVNPATGRLHTSLNQSGAATGRLSSSEPNLQNIPIRGEEGRRIRAAFVAPPGAILIAADYSQIELRVLAHLSGDPALVDAFTSGQDIHTRTAAEVFNVLPGLVSPDQRRAAKVINFGILYGMGPQRLAGELGIPLAEAQGYIANYFARYSAVRQFMDGVVAAARERGYATTILGRRRPIPELRSRERGVAQAAERVAANTPIQGSAADLIKLAMVRVERRLAEEGVSGGMILQVHDELLLEVAETDRERAAAVVREEMEGVMVLAVPLRVDLGVGHTWAEAH
ncbi:MAG TPA: DNA polymerase I [Candidatus Dormibacteraeota bacterium]|nr:DNA polymerase I [Candidatus Dormibacteraeota bacterium]